MEKAAEEAVYRNVLCKRQGQNNGGLLRLPQTAEKTDLLLRHFKLLSLLLTAITSANVYLKGLLLTASLRWVIKKEDWNCRQDGRLPN